MRIIAALRVAFVITATALAACGGGGGGGGAGGGGAGGGGAASFELNGSNAVAASAVALRVIEQPGVIAELPLIAAVELDQRRAERFAIGCGATSVSLRNTDADSDTRVSVGDSLIAEQTAPCQGALSRKITMRVSLVDVTSLRVEGSAAFEVETTTHDRMVGTFSLATSYDSPTRTVTFLLTDLALTSTRDGKVERLTGARFDRRFDAFSNYILSFSGQIDSGSLGGGFSFSTPTAFTGASGSLPNSGDLVSVAGRTRVRIAVSSDPAQWQDNADYQLDEGSGYRSMTSVRWRDLTGGLLFYFVPNDPPVISSLEVQPANPHTGSSVTAFVAATDPDGDSLTYEFTWNAGPETYANYGPVFSLVGRKKGDSISVTVKVSDGRLSATRTTSFTIGNAPPVFTSLTLDPPAPRSIDDLAAAAVFTDADGDPLSVRYEWKKNGTLISTGTTIAHSAYAKNDTIDLTVYVTDGSATVSKQATVKIGDSQPQLTWFSPPVATVAHGAPLSARATAADPDGDAVPPEMRFKLRYGPAGMTVDPTTGTVSWLAGGPMFERSMDVHYSVGTNIEGAGYVAGMVTVEDLDRDYPIGRSSMTPGRWYSGLRAGDFDGDGDLELLILTESGLLYELEATGNTYSQAWLYPFSLYPQPLALATADIDGDGAHEIFVATGNTLLRLDGVARRIDARATLPIDDSAGTCADLEAADLDRNGAIELVCSVAPSGLAESGASHPLFVIDPLMLTVARQIPGQAFGNDIAVGNVDADPALEIVTSYGFVFDGATLGLDWHSPVPFPSVAVGDVTGDGIAEIIASLANDSGTYGRVYSAQSQSLLFELPHPGYSTNVIANIDGTGRAEILMSGSRLGAYRYEPAGSVSTLFTLTLPIDRGAGTFAVSNVDADSRPEFVMGTGDSIDIADWPAAGVRLEWSTAGLEPAIPQTIPGPFFGGELARSPANAPQPLFMTAATGTPALGAKGARLLALDPLDGDLTISPEIPQGTSWFFDEGDLVVTDFDGDGTDEAFITVADGNDAAVGAYDFFAGQLTFRATPPLYFDPAIDIDHGDFNGDGHDDLVSLTREGRLRVFDVFAGTVMWSAMVQQGGDAVAVADLDGVGPPEIIATSYEQVLVYSRPSAFEPFDLLYESAPLYAPGDLTAGDVDGDGRVDIFIGCWCSDPTGYSVVRFNERLEPVARFSLDWQPTSLSIESSAFGRKNLVGTIELAEGSRLRVFDPVVGDEVWQSPPVRGLFAPNSIHFVDVAGDGQLRIAYGTYHGVFITR